MTDQVSPVTQDSLHEAQDRRDLSDLIDTLLQHMGLAAGVFLAVVLIGVGYAVFSTPVYKADALIQVEDKKPNPLGGLQDIANVLGAGASPVSGEVEILRSREVITKAIKNTRADIKLQPKYFPVIGKWIARQHSDSTPRAPVLGLRSYVWGGEVVELQDFSVPEEFLGTEFLLRTTAAGFEVEDKNGKLLASGRTNEKIYFEIEGKPASIVVKNITANPGAEFYLTRNALIDVYRDILNNLFVGEVGRQSSVIRVSYLHADADFAVALVNSIARTYLQQNVERRSAEADQSLKFLEQQLPEVRRQVVQAEDALNAFRTRTNTVSVEKTIDSLLQQAVETEKSRLQLKLKRDELRQRYRPEHPELRAIENQLAAMERENNIINEQVNKLPAAQRDLLRLQRDAEVSNELYVALLNNAQQLRIARAGTVGNVRIIDFAVRDNEVVQPRKANVILTALLLAAVLAIGSAFVARLLRPTVRDAEQVERATGLVSFASVLESDSQEKLDSSKRDRKGRQAIVPGRNQLLALLEPNDPAIEGLRSLRTGLSFATLGAANKNVVITGATSSLGKSFISANLSVLLATAGKKVLLIETDMRRPQLGTYFGYTGRIGLSNLLVGDASIDSVLLKNAAFVEGLDVLPSGETPPNPGELLLTDAFAKLLDSVQHRYDYIILDSAPVLPVGDTLAVANLASTVFLVVRAEVSTVREVRDAVRKLESTGGKVKGFIFNGIKRRRIRYGYTYKYYYGYDSKA